MIQFKNTVVSLSRDGRRNLKVSFCLPTGTLAVLVGPNGSGKSTLLDLIARAENATDGSIVLDPPKSQVAYAVQDAASGLLPWRTVLSNILLPANLNDGSHTANLMVTRATSLLDQFGLSERKNDYPYKLSEGEKQIVNLIRTVCTPADIVLLDEPFSSLSVRARSKAKAMLIDVIRPRTTLLVTHDSADLDWPISRCFQIKGSEVIEISLSEAKDFLEDGPGQYAI